MPIWPAKRRSGHHNHEREGRREVRNGRGDSDSNQAMRPRPKRRRPRPRDSDHEFLVQAATSMTKR
ncbi:hypothetical protein EJB05_47001 [Eragrostis curvula]|uniref:Uncharacterized protein n=1 Tax=Eragrostis curvula TaxID=38414 RepID=A0A5J9T6T1_9POAL|nr:hypothetical protein EJB05_47001 [Eragrostis curvula]